MADVKWIKLMVGMFDGASFKKIKKATLADGQSYRDKLTAVWFELLDLAAKKNLNGQLCNVEDLEIPFTSESQFEDIAIMIDRQPEEVSCCIGWFIKNKMIVIVDDIYSLANWEKYQEEDKLAQIREQNRIRKANQRARLTMSRDSHVTQRDCHALDIEEEIDKEIDKNISIINTLSDSPDEKEKENKINLKNEVYQDIFNYWISMKATIKHRELTDLQKKAIDKAIKRYQIVQIKDAIAHYDLMLRSNYYFNYKWSLEDFLSQSNALPCFTEEGSKWATFIDEVNKNPMLLPKEDRPEERHQAPQCFKDFYNSL